ncbi:MAG TPA: hydantoinase/oxoprolinase family protein [Stellaceae bacterium]|nr:hydantoinase/oxoprolinase family protein [Stellaceae bacterium]
MPWRVGIDSGGTFTDVCLFEEETGRIAVWKLSSTPADPSEAVAAGVVEGLGRVGAQAAEIAYFGHGTTVATNALIQQRGAPTGLVTTEGFRDLLEIGRQKRPDLYDPQADKPPVLVPRSLRREVPERLRHDGSVETPLDEAAVRAAARALREAGVAAVAICFLYSFLTSRHEEIAKRIIEEEFPEAFVSASHEVAPEFREFERLSTTVVNAYLGPVMRGYLAGVASRLEGLGVPVAPHITQSNGGVIGCAAAARLPVRTILSGPATGVVGAEAIGRLAGARDLITFDMGGTSTDVALLRAGALPLAGEALVHGYPLKAPMLDIHTVGAGGGSIAHVDAGGLLKVGPRSAGADPGPVAYGRGNQEATVTDANIVLQTLNPTHLLGGRMRVRQDLATAAIERLAAALGMERMATAQGIVAVVTANMARAIRVVSVERGHDPREYTLLAFGGAGPLHAARLARELETPRIVVPPNPGILCAMGLLLTDLRADFAATRRLPLAEGALGPLREVFAGLETDAEAWFEDERVAPQARHIARSVDMRYAGQNYELSVPLSNAPIGAATLAALVDGFAAAHSRRYGFLAEEEPVELVTCRVEATGRVRKAEFEAHPRSGGDPQGALIGRRQVWLPEAGDFVAAPIYARDRLAHGNEIAGPAVVEQMDATTLVLPGMVGRVDAHLNLVLEER